MSLCACTVILGCNGFGGSSMAIVNTGNCFFGLDGNQVYAKYFRTGVYTHLCLYPIRNMQAGINEVRWKYTFADLGMHFEIEKHFIVWADETVLDIQEGKLIKAKDLDDLRNILFDHYRPYVVDLYSKCGIACSPSLLSM